MSRPPRIAAAALATALAALCAAATPRAVAAPNPDDQLLAQLVQRANQEGRLVATVQSSWGQAMLPKLSDAFKKRFGLHIDVSLSPVASAKQFPMELAETKAGAPPTYDVVQGDDAETIQLTGGGGVQKVAHWNELLRAINPEVRAHKLAPSQISRGPFEGGSFLYMANVKEIIYNPKLISPSQLPRTHAELAEAKYKGKFTQPPWTSHWEIAPPILNNAGPEMERWLDVVRAAGKNSVVLSEVEGVQRVVLGQYAFTLGQDAYIRQTLAKDPQAPIAGTFFRDYNELNGVYYSVRTGAKDPAAATLWALWMTTPEAEAIWQPDNKSYVPYGNSAIDSGERDEIKRNGATVIGYLDNQKTIDLLRRQQTPEGTRYLTAVAKAIQGE